jgi:alcohol dehydrogenase, propanol-preferring
MEAWSVVSHGEALQKIQREIPAPTGTQVIIKVTHCGICHSDLHLWDGFFELGGGKKFYFAERGVKLPVAVGHEILGIIAAKGPDVKDVEVGERRIVYPWIGCGECKKCKLGQDNMCLKQQSLGIHLDGGFASHVVVKHSKYLVDPGDLDPAIACTFGCSAITVLNAIKKARLEEMEPEESVVVIGAGGLGLTAVAALKARGHQNIISVDIDPVKREVAIKTGASAAVDGKADDAMQQVLSVSGGPVPAVIDFVNNSQTAKLAYDLLIKGGKLVQVGVGGGELTVSLAMQILKALTVVGNLTGNLEDLKEVTRLAKEGKWAPIPITKISSEKADEALMSLRDGKVTGRLILTW